MNNSKIYIAGHLGMVGSAICRRLQIAGYNNLITRSHEQLDLTNQADVMNFFAQEKPDYIFLAAAKVGGIHANNTYRAEFIYQNLMIQNNVVHAAWLNGIERLLFLGSNCMYPRNCAQPIQENYLLTGPLEQTNEPYAIAKIAGIKLCENYNRQYGTQYICVIPTNLYGPNDNYDLKNSHVLPALIRKCHEAKLQDDKQLVVWGSGTPMREFLYVDDMADACVFLMERNVTEELFNIGSGIDISIRDLAEIVINVIGYTGEIVFDKSKPDGTPKKLLNVDRMKKFGWIARTDIYTGITKAYQDYLTYVE